MESKKYKSKELEKNVQMILLVNGSYRACLKIRFSKKIFELFALYYAEAFLFELFLIFTVISIGIL